MEQLKISLRAKAKTKTHAIFDLTCWKENSGT